MSRYIDADKLALFIVEHLPRSAPQDAYDAYSDVLQMLKDEKVVPTADVEEVRHGKWTKDEREIRDDGEIYDYCCSLCKSPAAEGSYGNHDVLTPYCSQCGARMQKEEEK